MSILDLTADAHLQRRPTSYGVRSRLDRFRARFDYLYQGLAVMCRETAPDVWSVSVYPGVATVIADSSNEYSSDYIFHGDGRYEVNGTLAAALVTAGYTVEGPAFSSGFDVGYEI